jgi:hypothetical protein
VHWEGGGCGYIGAVFSNCLGLLKRYILKISKM